jgi:hypothetical protein
MYQIRYLNFERFLKRIFNMPTFQDLSFICLYFNQQINLTD